MLLLLDVHRLDAFLHSRALELSGDALASLKSQLFETLNVANLDSVKKAAHLLGDTLKASATPAKQNVCFHGIAALYGVKNWNALRGLLPATPGNLTVAANNALNGTPLWTLLESDTGKFARFAFRVTFKPAGMRNVPDALDALAKRVRADTFLSLVTCVTPVHETQTLVNWRKLPSGHGPAPRPRKHTGLDGAALARRKVLENLTNSRRAYIEDQSRNGCHSIEAVVAPRVIEHFLILDLPLWSERDEARLGSMRDEAENLLAAEFKWGIQSVPAASVPCKTLPQAHAPLVEGWSWHVKRPQYTDAPDTSPTANWALLADPDTSFFTYAGFHLNSGRESAAEKAVVAEYGLAPLQDDSFPKATLQLFARSAGAAGLQFNEPYTEDPEIADLLSTLPTNASVLPSGTSGLLPISRHGNLQRLDLWHPGCGDTLIVNALARAGAGFLNNELITDTLVRDGKVIVWDHYDTRHLAGVMGGLHIDLHAPAKSYFNLVGGIATKEEFELRLPHITAFLRDIFAYSDNSEILGAFISTLRTAWERHGESLSLSGWLNEMGLSTAYHREASHELRTKLAPVRQWFEGETPLSFDKPIVVFSANGIDSDPSLKILVAASLALAGIHIQQNPDETRLLSLAGIELFNYVPRHTSFVLRTAMTRSQTRTVIRLSSAQDACVPRSFAYDQVLHSQCHLFLGPQPHDSGILRESPFAIDARGIGTLGNLRSNGQFVEAALQIQGQWMGITRFGVDPTATNTFKA